jgi:hypothetical protein
MPSYEMWCRMTLVRTVFSEKIIAYIFRVKTNETLVPTWAARRPHPEDDILHSHDREYLKYYASDWFVHTFRSGSEWDGKMATVSQESSYDINESFSMHLPGENSRKRPKTSVFPVSGPRIGSSLSLQHYRCTIMYILWRCRQSRSLASRTRGRSVLRIRKRVLFMPIIHRGWSTSALKLLVVLPLYMKWFSKLEKNEIVQNKNKAILSVFLCVVCIRLLPNCKLQHDINT